MQYQPMTALETLDTAETRDPVAEYGLSSDEYRRAKAERDRLNAADAPMARSPKGEDT